MLKFWLRLVCVARTCPRMYKRCLLWGGTAATVTFNSLRGISMNSDKNRPKRPSKPEEKWVDYDEETACWGIFGLNSGFCYGLYATEKEANKVLAADTRDRVANDRRIAKECYYL